MTPPAAFRSLPAAAVLGALLLAAAPACGGGDDAARRSASTAPQDGKSSVHRAVDQTTPSAAAESYFEAVRDASFEDACALLAPVARTRYAAAGQDCPTAMARLFDETTRAAIGDVTADDSKVDVVGDIATVPGDALTRADLPQGAPEPAFPTLRATRQDGAWFLVP